MDYISLPHLCQSSNVHIGYKIESLPLYNITCQRNQVLGIYIYNTPTYRIQNRILINLWITQKIFPSNNLSFELGLSSSTIYPCIMVLFDNLKPINYLKPRRFTLRRLLCIQKRYHIIIWTTVISQTLWTTTIIHSQYKLGNIKHHVVLSPHKLSTRKLQALLVLLN